MATKKRVVSPRVARTRADGTFTEARYWSFLRSGLRQVSVRWPPISNTLRAARVPYVGESKRRKWSYICSCCLGLFAQKDVQVDHIEECGSLKCDADIVIFINRLFCESSGLRVLCKTCHNKRKIKANDNKHTSPGRRKRIHKKCDNQGICHGIGN